MTQAKAMKIVVPIGEPLKNSLIGVEGDYIVIGADVDGSPIVRCPDGEVTTVTGGVLVVATWTPDMGRIIVPGL